MLNENTNRVIEMAWEDRTPFDAIQAQFGLSEKEVIKILRKNLKKSSFKLWRKRVSGRKTKHRKNHTTTYHLGQKILYIEKPILITKQNGITISKSNYEL